MPGRIKEGPEFKKIPMNLFEFIADTIYVGHW